MQDEREEIMQRMYEEEREQMDADARVDSLKKKVEMMRLRKKGKK